MTCIILVQNPTSKVVLALTEDDGEMARWPNANAAAEAMADHTLVEAWGGYVIDLDKLEITEI